MNIGISKLPEVYHPSLIARLEAFILILRKQVRLGKSPSGVDYTATVQDFVHNQITDMLLEHLGMVDMSVTLNDEVIYVPQSMVFIPGVSLQEQVSKATGVPTVKEAIGAWLGHISSSGRSTRTLASYKGRIGILTECMDVDSTLINEVTYHTLSESLWNPDAHKSLKGKASNGQEVVIVTLRSFFSWCMEVYPTVYPVNYKNPASALKPHVATEKVDKETGQIVRTVTRAAEQRDAYTEEEVSHIMTSLMSIKNKDAMDWYIIASFLSGARLNEIAQLHKEDVTMENDVVTLRIARTFPDQSLKNTSSERVVPLGFPCEGVAEEFYQFTQSQNKEAFFGFPYSKAEGNYKPNLSRKYQIRMEKYGLAIKGKSQHSCRHTILTFMKKCDVREDVSKQFAGHSNEGNMTTGRYGKPYTSEELYSRLKDAGVYDYYYGA